MKVLLFSRYDRQGASSRIRSFQYLPFLRKHGIEVFSRPLFDKSYLETFYSGKGRGFDLVFRAYLDRIFVLLRSKSFDLVWIEKEVFPWLPPLAEALLAKAGIPCLVDFDDAIFHSYDQNRSRGIRLLLGNKIDHIVRGADLVIGGNSYLCDHFRKAGASRVEKLPSVIDLERYRPIPRSAAARPFTIGWIGSPTTTVYLHTIAPVLRSFVRRTGSRLVLVGSGRFEYDGLPVESRPWHEESEVRDLYDFDAGIMPLDNTPWAMGKCGYKLIQYMACSKPVIASKVGANCEIVRHGESGFLVENEGDWHSALWRLYSDSELRKRMGACGRRIVEDGYCLQKTARVLAAWLWELHGGRGTASFLN